MKKGGFATLDDYHIPSGATIHLMIVLFAIPEDLDHVIFDIYWRVPAHVRCDFLDASCFLYDSNHQYLGVIDYANERNEGGAVLHSGDSMDRVRRIGQHRVEVRLKGMPGNVSYLVFALSAWNSKKIGLFEEPSLRFYEAGNIFKHLCEKKLSTNIEKQAVIVCCVYRTKDHWTIFESGTECDGNTDAYDNIKRGIENDVIQYCV